MPNLTVENTLLTIIDMQEKFAPAIPDFEAVAARAEILVRAAKELSLEVAVTRQYPKGLGETVAAIRENLSAEAKCVDKTCFSCLDSPEFRSLLTAEKTNLVFVGVEAHICVLMSAIMAVEAGYAVWVLMDATASRNSEDRQAAFDFLREKGVNLLGTESFLFFLMRSSEHLAFRKVQALIK